MTGIVPSEEFNEQLKRVVRETIRRERPNVGPPGRWHKKGGGGGVHIMAFEILYADCDEGVLTTDISAIERYTGCGTPPGADEYGTYFIEDYFGFMNDLTDPELIGPRALAIYWNDWAECEKRWDLLMVEWNGGC